MSVEHTDTPIHEVVRASAGAGKTYQLTTRYLDLLSRGEQVDHILATTFTRKAAGEVLGRVLERVSQACLDRSAREALGKAVGRTLSDRDCTRMLRSLTDHFSRLSVGTIDGFFNRAARAMALELGLPADPRLIDEGSALARQMRMDAIHAVLGEKAAGDDGMTLLLELLRRLHHDDATRSVAEALDQIVTSLGETYRSYDKPELWVRFPETGLLTDEQLTTALHRLEAMSDQVPRKKDGGYYANFVEAYPKLIAHSHARQWDKVLANGLVKKVDEQAPKYGHAPISEAWHDAIRPLLVHAKAWQLKAFADRNLATYELLEMFDRQYRALRQSRRVLLFSDLTHLLAEGLPRMEGGGIEELCYRLDTRVTHLLLDEFQDTSLRQWQVLEPFAEQITATSDGSRSLYVVGDTKQAIYGWRGGCAELFEVIEQQLGVPRTTLSRSWRSAQAVLDAVNRVFSNLPGNAALKEIGPVAQKWSDMFEAHEAVHADLPGHVAMFSTANSSAPDSERDDEEDESEDADAPPDAHAAYVARHIKRLTEQMPGRTIGVLVRARKSARTLMHALRDAHVDAAEEGGNPIVDTPAVSAVLSAIQLADHPGDTIARFHAANAPVGEVLGLAAAVTDHDCEKAARRLRRELIDRGYAAVIADWVRRLAPSCDAKSLRRLEQLVDLAEGFDEQDAGLRPSFFVDAVRAARVEDASPADVRVMTVHASKGLEFDVVVLADLHRTLSQSDRNDLVVLHRDSPIDKVRAVYRRVKQEQASLHPDLEAAHEQHSHEKRTEDLCLLYVAMTRARQALHLMVKPLKQGKNGKPTTAGLTNLSYAAILRQALTDPDDEGFDGGELLYEHGDARWHEHTAETKPDAPAAPPAAPLATPLRLAQPEAGGARAWAQTTPSAMHAGGTVAAEDLLRLTDPGGRRYGTLMHALFEQLGFLDAQTTGRELPDDDALQRAAQAAGATPADAQRAVDQLKRSIGRPEVAALLSANGADTLWRERPFVARVGDQLVRGTFDRVHLHRHGQAVSSAVLIDFKTDRVDDATIDAVAAGYADQLGLYRAALASLLGIDASQITAKLCFVGDGRVAQLPA